ncbi:MAG: hypothetical protein CG437_683 [Methanosaeta sp. NSP1]|nr:MAG: hypothetical protein CG437_683 [Methanosaeta sp. NSP1]
MGTGKVKLKGIGLEISGDLGELGRGGAEDAGYDRHSGEPSGIDLILKIAVGGIGQPHGIEQAALDGDDAGAGMALSRR